VQRSRFQLIVLTVTLPLWVINPAPSCQCAEAKDSQPTSVAALLVEFQKPYERGKRQAIAAKILKAGPGAAKKLNHLASVAFDTQYRAYLGVLQQAAGQQSQKKAQGPKAQIEALRRKVLALQKRSGLTKQDIINEADPAMKRLKELIPLPAAIVLSKDQRSSLAGKRLEIYELGIIWVRAYALAKKSKDSVGLATPPDMLAFKKELVSLEKFAAKLALPMSLEDRKVLIANLRMHPKLDPMEASFILKLNVMRIRLGVRALLLEYKLVEAARGHSQDMKDRNFIGHVSPVPGKKQFTDRARLAGTTAHAENISFGRTSAEDALNGWWYSPSHHVTMLNPYSRTGVGRVGLFWTHLFGLSGNQSQRGKIIYK